MREREDEGWLLIAVSTGSATASLRVFVWRKLRGLGALYVQQSACLLPDRPEVRRQLQRLLHRVAREGGQGRLLRLRLVDEDERRAVVAELQAARDAEYADLLERLPSFFAELEMETARGRASYVEVEESEADLTRFRNWAKKIEQRDYFGAPLRAAVRMELGRAAEALSAFEAAALAAESAPYLAAVADQDTVTPPSSAPRLRAVDPS